MDDYLDPHLEIDSPYFHTVEYQACNELCVFCADGRHLLVFEVSEKTFRRLCKDPSEEMIRKIISTHPHRYQR